MQYHHLVRYVVVGPNAIPSIIVPNLALQKVPLLIQDDNGNVSEWAQKGSKCFYKVDACTRFSVAKWLFC